MRTVDDVIAEARKRGLFLNNLFELTAKPEDRTGNGQYQANFRHANGWHDFGRGGSPVEAIENALDRCKGAQGPENRPIPKAVKAPQEDSIEDLL